MNNLTSLLTFGALGSMAGNAEKGTGNYSMMNAGLTMYQNPYMGGCYNNSMFAMNPFMGGGMGMGDCCPNMFTPSPFMGGSCFGGGFIPPQQANNMAMGTLGYELGYGLSTGLLFG